MSNETMKRVSVDDVYDAEIESVTAGVPGVGGRFFRISYPDIEHPLVAAAILDACKRIKDAYRQAVQLEGGDD